MQPSRLERPASAERTPADAMARAHRLIAATPEARLLDALPTSHLVLDANRQIVFANAACRAEFKLDADAYAGQRLGEALGCIHARDAPGGCGTSDSCRTCQAVRQILSCIEGDAGGRECTLLFQAEGDVVGMEVDLHAAPFAVGGGRFNLVTLRDISDFKRRRYLERIFLHDLTNSVGGAWKLAELLKPPRDEADAELHAMLVRSLAHIVDEIENQKLIFAAENNDLRPKPCPMSAAQVIADTAKKYRAHLVTGNRRIVVDTDCGEQFFVSDPVILQRVFGNMIKNALEAVPDGETVTLGCAVNPEAATITFRVHNGGCIPEEMRAEIFKRSFSTKGEDRGLGTFSILLLTHNYLRGRARFESTPERGTTFYVDLPLDGGPEADDCPPPPDLLDGTEAV
jgi:nitrogen-specific signal transduction histidine kinase